MRSTYNKFLFIGEERSKTAIERGWTWEDGRLAAKQLFDCLLAIDIEVEPETCKFMNWFEEDYPRRKVIGIARQGYVPVAMGAKVHKAMTEAELFHLHIVHPAARGTIRKKENYTKHLKEKLINENKEWENPPICDRQTSNVVL